MTQPQSIIVTKYAATHPTVVPGRGLHESDAISRARAEEVATALVRMGLARDRIVTQWRDDAAVEPALAAGLPESSNRRVVISMQSAAAATVDKR